MPLQTALTFIDETIKLFQPSKDPCHQKQGALDLNQRWTNLLDLTLLDKIRKNKKEVPLPEVCNYIKRGRDDGCRWKRISGTDTRAWTAIKYACNLFNKHLEKKVFDVRRSSLRQGDIKELVEETVEKAVEFA